MFRFATTVCCCLVAPLLTFRALFGATEPQGNWGQFESVISQPAGQGASVEFRYRNAKRVEFVAHEINVGKLLDDVKTYLKSKPQQLDWKKVNLSDIGYRLIHEHQKQYLGEEVARWHLDLEPLPNDVDRRITITTPLQKAGAYLLTANTADGNHSTIVLWLVDTGIVRKPMSDKSFYYVADAVTGAPIAGAKVEFFAYRRRHIDGDRYEIDTKSLEGKTNGDGQVVLPLPVEINEDGPQEYQWLATATTPQGRLAYLGFHDVWRAPHADAQLDEVMTFTITDRPVYRPAQTVHYKVWIRRARYDVEEKSEFAHQTFVVEIHNPRGAKVHTGTLTSDNYGGIAGKFDLPADAVLGQYQLAVVGRGGGTFRVEEYKKPKFEVAVDTPDEPITLGENFKATIRATYNAGSPVTRATVKYKVLRTAHANRWFPPARWDWLYGPGYWWFAPDHEWYPGWVRWGFQAPSPSWHREPCAQPEIVLQRKVPMGPDGTVEVEIDTSLAKTAHPNDDHRYEIHAEVTDRSRRTMVGRGELLAARRPFDVCVWVDRGYYQVGDTIQVGAAARRLDGKPVQADGTLRLLKITYGDAPERKPIETEVRSWNLDTNGQGSAELQVKASESGQYRLAYTATNAAGQEVQAGYLFTIIGSDFDASQFRFNDLEVIPAKRHYAPGDKVELQINTNRTGSTVLLFVRPSSGVYLPPQMLRLDGRSTVVQLDVEPRDMPNFFVEAVTIAGGKVHTVVREIHLPSVKRILNVDVVPSAHAYQPGQQAKIKLKVTDEAGRPVVGSTAISIYDKRLEHISGGSNVPDIKSFFWRWRREHRPHLESNLERWSSDLVGPDEERMQSLADFGDSVADHPRRDTPAASEAPDRAFAGGVAGRGELFLSADFATAAGRFANAPPSPSSVEPTVRSEFADTALWVASLETDQDGLAEVELKMPENLTTWRFRAWSMGHGTRVGEASAEIVTRRDLVTESKPNIEEAPSGTHSAEVAASPDEQAR